MNNLKLFSQVNVGRAFRLEHPKTGQLYFKTSKTSATKGDYTPVDIPSGTLVFQLRKPISDIEFSFQDGHTAVAHRLSTGRWFLTYQYPVSPEETTIFNTIDDVINHLEN